MFTLRTLPTNKLSSNPLRPRSLRNTRGFCTSKEDPRRTAPRDVEEVDVVIVGAGPAGLSAAIRLKQLAAAENKEIRVVVVEKGASVGDHILSGCVLQPTALNELIPDWKEKGAPLNTPATNDQFWFLSQNSGIQLPTPPQMHNEGNYIVSLSNVVRWLGQQAEEAGVEIFPGISASELLLGENGNVTGIATGDVGIGKSGDLLDTYARGLELKAKLTLIGEGCRGSLTRQLFDKYKLREGVDPQSYGIGLKEVWEVPKENHQPGLVVHTIGFPGDNFTYAGSFLYHLENNQIALGYVIGLDYSNTYLTPYREFQKWKTHPKIRKFLEGGKPIYYGARLINEGGYQAIPKLDFPGGALIGCSAGFLNVPKIKGTHTAMKSGMVAAEVAFDQLKKSENSSETLTMKDYQEKLSKTWVYDELYKVRNIRPSFHNPLGTLGGLAYSAIDTYLFRGKAPWTFHFQKPDHEYLKPAAECKKPDYPKPDGVLTFDLLTNLARSGTNHNEDQPPHLKLKDPKLPIEVNMPVYDNPETRYCPAGVYEIAHKEDGAPYLQINAQNCLHCKTCDAKDPLQNIVYNPPEGGGGPAYAGM